MKTEGEAGEGVADDELVSDAGGGSAEATGVEVDAADPPAELVAVAVTVPTVRVKLAVTRE